VQLGSAQLRGPSDGVDADAAAAAPIAWERFVEAERNEWKSMVDSVCTRLESGFGRILAIHKELEGTLRAAPCGARPSFNSA
jgi:hypothetical protein